VTKKQGAGRFSGACPPLWPHLACAPSAAPNVVAQRQMSRHRKKCFLFPSFFSLFAKLSVLAQMTLSFQFLLEIFFWRHHSPLPLSTPDELGCQRLFSLCQPSFIHCLNRSSASSGIHCMTKQLSTSQQRNSIQPGVKHSVLTTEDQKAVIRCLRFESRHHVCPPE
jgi:hypothetical protein